MGKHPEYDAQTQVMTRIRNLRIDRQLSIGDCARIVQEATGYHFTDNMYHACETGVTKNVPLWVIIALLGSEEMAVMTSDDLFGDVMYKW